MSFCYTTVLCKLLPPYETAPLAGLVRVPALARTLAEPETRSSNDRDLSDLTLTETLLRPRCTSLPNEYL